jgi:hypothetical protein
MKRVLIAAAAVVLTGCNAAPQAAIGNGESSNQALTVPTFNKVVNATGFRTRIDEGGAQLVFTTIDSNLQEAFWFTVTDGELRIAYNDDYAGLKPHVEPVIDITLPLLLGARTEGAGPLEVKMTQPLDRTFISYGDGPIAFTGAANTLEVQTFGAAPITMKGTAAKLVATTFGKGGINALGLDARSADLTTYGSGNITVDIKGGPIHVHAGNIDVWGQGEMEELVEVGTGVFTGHWTMPNS